MMGTPKACPVWWHSYPTNFLHREELSAAPARFAAVFDSKAGRWRGASLPVVPGSSVLIMSFAPAVKPGAFCDPRAAWESRAAALRLMKCRS